MFTREITNLTLTKPVADPIFPNISGVHYRNDQSFLATLRALMYKRVPKGESIRLACNTSWPDVDAINRATPRDCVRAFLRNTNIMGGAHGEIHIHSFDNNEAGQKACFEKLDAGGVTALFDGYVDLPDVAKWIEQCGKATARIYLNEEKKNVLIFVGGLDMKRWHLLQSLTPRFFPWYMKDNPLDEEEVGLIKSLTKRYAPEYEERIEAFAKHFDFRTQAIRNALTGFETRFERVKLDNVRREIRNIKNNIENLEAQFRDYYRRLDDKTTTELGLIAKINGKDTNGEDSEFLQYFLRNKGLNLVSSTNGSIEFIVTTTIANYDPDVFDSYIETEGSFFYRHYETHRAYGNKEMTDERIKRLMLAIFRDEILKLRVCAAYTLDFENGYAHAHSGYHFPAEVLREHTPNQHIQHYACLGDNRPIIRRAMTDHDYVGAVTACCSSAMNMNMTEPNTGTYFMEKICANDVGRIIQMPDGSTMTPLDAVKWLEERDVEKKKEKEKEANE